MKIFDIWVTGVDGNSLETVPTNNKVSSAIFLCWKREFSVDQTEIKTCKKRHREDLLGDSIFTATNLQKGKSNDLSIRTSTPESFCKRFRGLLTQLNDIVLRETGLSARSAGSWGNTGWPSALVDESDAAAARTPWRSGNFWCLCWGVEDLHHRSICSWTLSFSHGVTWGCPLGVSHGGSAGWGVLALGFGGRLFRTRLLADISGGGVLKPLKGGNGSLWAKHRLGSRKIITASQKCSLNLKYGWGKELLLAGRLSRDPARNNSRKLQEEECETSMTWAVCF